MATPKNSRVTTPVTLMAYEGTDPIPVTFESPAFPVKHQNGSAGAFVTQQVVAAVPGEIGVLCGFNANPSADQNYVQLFDAAALVSPGAIPLSSTPVRGTGGVYSFGVDLRFSTGLVIALSTMPLEFAAPADNWLSWVGTFWAAS